MNLLIIGAGVEKSTGIDMPLANELVPQIRSFIYEDETGKEVDNVLRDIIKGLRFSYDDFIKRAVDKLASEFKKEVDDIVHNITVAKKSKDLGDDEKKLADIIIFLLTKIQNIQKEVILDDETAQKIKEVFTDIPISDENIVDLGKLSFTDTFELVMRRILLKSIEQPTYPVLKHIYRNLMDFENLLLKYFIGFYNENEPDIKKYLYLSWSFWSYLVWKEKKVNNINKIPFYSDLNQNMNIITFNYTSFAGKINSQTKYFHGSLTKYIRLDNRNESQIDQYDEINIINFLKEVVSNNINLQDKKFVIPSIVPPLKLKPVLSSSYIETWYKSKELIEQASKIIIVGLFIQLR